MAKHLGTAQEAQSTHLRAALFIVVGALLVVASVVFEKNKQTTMQSVALNLGLVSISIVLLDYLWRLSGGSPIEHQIHALADQIGALMKSVRIIDDGRTVGLRAAYKRQGDFGTQGDWESLISSSTREVDIMGRTTHGWTRSREVADLIERKIIRDGVVFRWLIMATDNKYLQLLTEEDINIGAMLKEKLTHVANFLQSIQSRLPEDKRKLLQIRVFSHVPLYCGTVRVDDQIYVTPYLFSRSSDSSPLLVLEGRESAWVKTYVTEFELVWNAAHKVSESLLVVGDKPGGAITRPMVQSGG